MINKGDKVIIIGSAEENKYSGCVFEVLSEPYDVCGSTVVMRFEEKVINFIAVFINAYRDEENQEQVQKMELNDDNLTEDFTAMVYALNMFFDETTGQEVDIIDFTHLLNKLVVQHLLEQKEGGKHE